jgi:RNase H-fold protein (predicted Holliday junction resolvase)
VRFINLILGIDAGSHKVGYAILDEKNSVFLKGIILLNDFRNELLKLLNDYKIEAIVVGSGTGHKRIVEFIGEINPNLEIVIISEKNSSVEAKWRYLNSLKGLKGFFYKLIGYADKPIDDISAQIIAERYLKERGKKN